MGGSMSRDALQVVHPGPHVEYFRAPITAGEIMDKYPRHCLARPDFFEFPWIVVHPESVLLPGKMFYLVPYRTVYNRVKALMQQQQQVSFNNISKIHKHKRKHEQSSKLYHCNDLDTNIKQQPPSKSLIGVAPKRQQKGKNKSRQPQDAVMDQELYGYTRDQDSETSKNFYKLSFYKSWNNMRRNLHQPQESCNFLYSGLDSPFDGGRSCFSLLRSEQSRVTSPSMSPEHVESLDVKSCLRKVDSARKELKLKVNFLSPVVPGSQQESQQRLEKIDLVMRQHVWLQKCIKPISY